MKRPKIDSHHSVPFHYVCNPRSGLISKKYFVLPLFVFFLTIYKMKSQSSIFDSYFALDMWVNDAAS